MAVAGILGGVFDPPHNGHVSLARAAIGELLLDELLVLVVADPGHKQATTPADVRLELDQPVRLGPREKADPSAVGRKKRRPSVVDTGQQMTLDLVKPTHRKPPAAGRGSADAVDELPPVRRDGEITI